MRLRAEQTEMTQTFIRMWEGSGFTYCEACSDEHGAMMHYPGERCPKGDPRPADHFYEPLDREAQDKTLRVIASQSDRAEDHVL